MGLKESSSGLTTLLKASSISSCEGFCQSRIGSYGFLVSFRFSGSNCLEYIIASVKFTFQSKTKWPAWFKTKLSTFGRVSLSRFTSFPESINLSSLPTTTNVGTSNWESRGLTRSDPTIIQLDILCSSRLAGSCSSTTSNNSFMPCSVCNTSWGLVPSSIDCTSSKILSNCSWLGIVADRTIPPITEYGDGSADGQENGKFLVVASRNAKSGAATSQMLSSKDVAGLTNVIPLMGLIFPVLDSRFCSLRATAGASRPLKLSPIK